MELKAFIKESLVEIGQAIHEANTQIENSPFMLEPTAQGKTTGIDFDVAVTTKAGSGAKGSITVWGIGIGGELLAFNVDRNFSNALDGLVLVDLRKTDPARLETYMGKDGVERFMQHHGELAASR